MARAEATGDSGRSAKWEARRQAIIDTSASVFARRGYHATGVAEARAVAKPFAEIFMRGITTPGRRAAR
jgi:AcrR family transcriptional regulator